MKSMCTVQRECNSCYSIPRPTKFQLTQRRVTTKTLVSLSSPLSLSMVMASSRRPIRLSAAARPSGADGKLCAPSAEASQQCQKICSCPPVVICSSRRRIVIAPWPEEIRVPTSRGGQTRQTEPHGAEFTSTPTTSPDRARRRTSSGERR